ncbi:MAG: Ig-like domain-containing protein [Acidobacteriota bacterium]|nr:Ig-like domain-containing protein [Acidobacteriota bacterium]
MTSLDGGRWTTESIDRNVLPIDGVIREGRYLLLAANAPIAFARGIVRVGTGVATRDARIITPGLGVTDLSRVSGIFNIPIPATPAAPFSLVPRIVAAGDGATYTHPSAPAANAVVNVGDLLIVAQPPQVASTIPTNNATNVSLTTTVEATITPAVDPSSITATSITVIDTTNGSIVPGTAAANGVLGIRWTLPAGETLQAGRRYVAAIAATIRGTNGSPLGQTYTFAFTTAASVTNDEVHPERIRITIPDANGVSKVIGTAGALKAGWLAVPVRRGNDFLTRYSAEAVADGSFSVTIGTNSRDRVSITDTIDLRVLNANGALVALIPLTPFAAEDGKAFIAPARTAVSFTSVDGITIDVPAGAFDVATRIDVTPASPAAFNGIPRLAQELVFAGTADVKFEGRAKVPLQLTIPIAAGTDVNREFFLAMVGQSQRGPKLMAIDTLTVADGKLTTRPAQSNARGLRTNAATSGAKDILQKFIQAGQFAAAMMHPSQGTLAWSFLNTGATVNELHWNTLSSMYVSQTYVAEADGAVAFPVPANTSFVLTAIDPANGLTAFEETYNGIPIGAPGTGTPIPNPDTDFNGPHPVFATPFRVETTTAPAAGATLQAICDLEIKLSDTGVLSVKRLVPLSADTRVSVLDVESGERRGPQALPITMNDVKAGDRLVIAIDEKDIDQSATVSVVFNEPIEVGGATSEVAIDAFLRSVIRFERVDPPASAGVDLLASALLRLDSSGRRVTILLPSLLEAGVRFRLTLHSNITDRSGNNLKLGQAAKRDQDTGVLTPIGPAPAPMELWFKTRGPKGTFAEFDIRQTDAAQFGAVREIARYDNVFFVAALDGGVLAYDISDSEALTLGSNPKPMAIAPGRDSASTSAVTEYWSVHVDHHGRVFSTGMANMFGALRTWRVEDFVKASKNTGDGCLPTMKNTVCSQTGGAITSQNPGTAYGVGLASAFVAEDRVEAIPRKAKFVIGDAEPVKYDWATFVSAFCGGAATEFGDGIHQKCNPKIPASGSQYRIQRITIENVRLGVRRSEDAIDNEPAQMFNVMGAPDDEMLVTHNLTTYAVISLFGWGIGVFDVNGIESNEVPGTSPSGIVRAKEQVALRAYAESPAMPQDLQSVGDLAFSPKSHILESNTNTVKVYSLDTRKGVVEFVVTPPAGIEYTGKIVLTGGAHPRFEALKTALVAAGNASPLARFNTGALYRNPDTGKDYLLIAALDYGLVVVEVGEIPLNADSFADAVAIPDGAWAVRVIEKTNMAVVVDGTGRVLLIDLARVDERDRVSAPDELFPTVAQAVANETQDPRILWKSEEPIAVGNIPPLVNPETGMLIGADLLGRRIRQASAIDPEPHTKANIGEANDLLNEVGSIVPLGVEPPLGILKCDLATQPDCKASLAVFRIEASLPGSMTESLGGQLSIALESEGVPNSDTPQTPGPYPPSHLRQKKRDGNLDPRATTDFALKRVLEFAASTDPDLRYQEGWNRFASDWIVAIADPRAAKDAGPPPSDCTACKRPAYLASLPNVREIYTAGRFLTIRAELNPSGPYGFLAEDGRFRKRISTIQADTVRPASVLVAAQAPPIAGGLLQETTYLHSGEVETSTVDLVAGGRAGWNVVVDRTYRSRTIGLTNFGNSWDSAMFRRLRALPNGNVEYRDGAEIWTFKFESGEYKSPAGLSLKLVKRDGGWNLIDQRWRIATFDDLGRIISESDEFYSLMEAGSGNVIRYLYGADGRLATIVDPVGRQTTLSYNATSGFVEGVTDWRGRSVGYETDAQGRLLAVKLPEAKAASGVPTEFDLIGTLRPKVEYTYQPAGGTYKDRLELATNLKTVKDPGVVSPRVTFNYDLSTDPLLRDRVLDQAWATGESATFAYPSPTQVVAIDAMGQKRTYQLTDPAQYDKRVHIRTVTEHDVLVVGAGALPATAPTNSPATSQNLVTMFDTHNEQGQVVSARYPNGLTATNTWNPARNTAAGTLLTHVAQNGPGVEAETALTFDQRTAANIVKEISRKDGSLATLPREAQSPSRERSETVTTDAEIAITTATKYNSAGQVTVVMQSTAPGAPAAISAQTVHYAANAPNPHDRSRPFFMRKGTDLEKYNLLYFPAPGGGERIEVRDMVRDTVTEKVLDAYGRTTSEVTRDAAGQILTDERYGYDGAGRLRYHSRKQSPLGNVETHVEYDTLGRQTERTTSHAEVNGTLQTLTARTQWQLGLRKITRFDPVSGVSGSEPREVQTLDGLGRPLLIERTDTTGNRIRTVRGYDAIGNLAYESDGTRVAAQRQFDALGREVAVVASDGTKSEMTWNAWNEPLERIARDASGTIVAHAKSIYTAKGRLRATSEEIGGSSADARQTLIGWSDGGKTTTSRVGSAGAFRVMQSERDGGGRVVATLLGGATTSDSPVTDVFARQDVPSYRGSVPELVTAAEPKASAQYQTSLGHDGLGRPTSVLEAGGAYATSTQYDEAGNVRLLQRPGLAAEQASYDGRGLLTQRVLADGKILRYIHDAIGNLRQSIDEAGEITNYETDSLGRIKKTLYPDGTSEEVVFEDATGAIVAERDRSNQWLSYVRDAGGRIIDIKAGQDPNTAPLLVRYEYDGAGRLASMRNKDAGVAYEDLDLLGRASITKAFRYASGSGLDALPTVLDIHTQRHVWNLHDERRSWRMPAAGTAVPTSDDPASPWLQTIIEERDAGGNLVALRNADGLLMFEGEARSSGRLKGRNVWTSDATLIATQYGYADGSAPSVPLPDGAPPPPSGLPLWSATSIGGVRVAGSSNMRDAAKRLESTRELALGDRLSSWDYDGRGRLTDAWLRLSELSTSPVTDSLIDADFREKRTVSAALGTAEHALLGDVASLALEPPTWTATKTSSAHQIDTRTLYLDGVAKQTLDYSYTGARRTSDGVWSYTFDELGRVTSATATTLGRKVDFTWNPNDRLVGRTAYRASATVWSLEDRADVLARDGVPADVTFVWDPVVDRLVSMFARGVSTAPGAGGDAGLIRQYLHGDNGYDDPVQVRVAASAGMTPAIYYPIADEAGTGSLAAIIDDDGNLIERVLYADSYGDAPRYLQGAVVDRITLEAKKTPGGSLESVNVRMHLSEKITAATLSGGVRLASVRTDNTIAQTAGVAPSLEDDHTILWSLSGSDWDALTSASGAQSLELSVTSTLRAQGWGATPVSSIPAWALRVYAGAESTADSPIIKRELLSLLTTFIAAIPNGETQKHQPLYEISSLYLAANEESKAKLLLDFKLMFREPATQLVYARNRWLSTADGQFLTPDPMGTFDSNNLHVFCGASPVECSDPLGLFSYNPAAAGHWFEGLGNSAKGGVARGSDWLTPNTGFRVLDDYINQRVSTTEVSLMAGIDLVTGIPAGLLTIGEGTGTSIIEEGCHDIYSCGMTTSAVLADVSNTILYAVGIAGAGESMITRASNRLMSAEMFDMSLSSQSATGITDGLAPMLRRTQANLSRGNAMETLARQGARDAGETIIETQFRRGAATRGFDFLSFSGEGANARLFINEVKHEGGRVGSRRFTSFGLGRSGMQTFDDAFRVAQQRIARAGFDRATQEALLGQLRSRTARIRLIGGQRTVFDPLINQAIGARTGFITGQGFMLP